MFSIENQGLNEVLESTRRYCRMPPCVPLPLPQGEFLRACDCLAFFKLPFQVVAAAASRVQAGFSCAHHPVTSDETGSEFSSFTTLNANHRRPQNTAILTITVSGITKISNHETKRVLWTVFCWCKSSGINVASISSLKQPSTSWIFLFLVEVKHSR